MTKVGPFLLREKLGEGNHGRVHKAVHNDTGEEFAVKILVRKDIQALSMMDQVRQEIAIMKALDHPNIVKLHSTLATSAKLYLVMELVKGQELFDMIEQQGKFDEATAKDYFRQLVDGVAYCHSKKVYHRDIKPENLLVDKAGVLKVADFGVSSVKKDENEAMHTACGTPYYCAPEIFSSEGYTGEKIDSWSCGVILYLLLTGNLPFMHDDLGQLTRLVKECKINYPASISPVARDLLTKIFVKDPTKRWSVAELKSHPWFLPATPPRTPRSEGNISNVPSLEEMELESAAKGHKDLVLESAAKGNKDLMLESPPRVYREDSKDLPTMSTGMSDYLSTVSNGTASMRSLCSLVAPPIDVSQRYRDRPIIEFLRDALPGKPDHKLHEVEAQLSEVDVDCVEDLQAVADAEQTQKMFKSWLQGHSVKEVSALRIAKMFYP